MNHSALEIKTKIQILKPVDTVYEALVNPEQMSNYFLEHGSGRMEEGRTITWKFPEFDMEFPVRVAKIEPHRCVSFYWETEGRECLVEIQLESNGTATIVTVTEKSMPLDAAGLQWLKGNTEGWANFLACLKAYLEYGINLRKGAFDFLKKDA